VTLLSHHLPGKPSEENVHNLTPEELRVREVVIIDISGEVNQKDYLEAEDPTKFRSEKAGRGPLQPGWFAHVSKTSFCKCHMSK